MRLSFLREVFEQQLSSDAIVWQDRAYTYEWLLGRVDHWNEWVAGHAIEPGTVAALEGDFSPNAVALFLALTENSCAIVPLTSAAKEAADLKAIAQVEVSLRLDRDDQVALSTHELRADHELYNRLRGDAHPGLVLFSSGSTGPPKAAVHDLVRLLDKFRTRRRSLRCVTFLLYDHIGGVNTMLYTLSNGGCMVTLQDRSPDAVLAAVARHRVELLPVAPTFLTLVLLSRAYERHRLDSLEVVTYGTEPMPESTLKRFCELFPHIDLRQTYGLSEVGILRSKSKTSDSLWMRIGGEGFETRVVDGVLHIKAHSAMLGYLNAPSPFTDDGWLDTGDVVEVDGEYVRVLGRGSDVMNVGGQKVYPAEVESVVQELGNVAEVTVFGEDNPITGEIVCARVRPMEAEDSKALARRVRRHCRDRLEAYKVPVKVLVTEMELHTERFKKVRRTLT